MQNTAGRIFGAAQNKTFLEAHNGQDTELVDHQTRPFNRAVLAPHGMLHLLTSVGAPYVEARGVFEIRARLEHVRDERVHLAFREVERETRL